MINSPLVEKCARFYLYCTGSAVEAAREESEREAAREVAFRLLKAAGSGPVGVEYRPGTAQFADRWEAERLDRVPRRWQIRMAREFVKLGARSSPAANAWLRDQSDLCAGFRIGLGATDDDIVAEAKRAARECFDSAAGAGFTFDRERLIDRMREFCARWQVTPPDAEKCTPEGQIGRMTDERWWRRQLRKVHGRGLEGMAVRLGFVHRRAGMYCSDETLQQRQQQKRRNAATLKEAELENEWGQRFTLEQLAALSVANPAIRRGELMTRIAGFESFAKAAGHVGQFVTLTCPSEYHARISGTCEENPKYAGHTPRDGQAYLQGIWQRIRAAMARRGVRLYGFRISEPHHDGCPHWHMLFFMAAEHVEAFRSIMKRYALEKAGDEAGAQKNRVKFVTINWEHGGSAAGYIAKYVAKNIDGHGVGLDLEGKPAVESAMRVDAWASRWGIRQFQQIGGPPVGVWRELRRIGQGATPATERARSAADAGNWGAYVAAMGGPTAKRVHMPVGMALKQREEQNRYGEPGAWVPFGVRDVKEGVVSESRRFVWRVCNRRGAGGEISAPRSPVNNCTRQDGREGLEGEGGTGFAEIGREAHGNGASGGEGERGVAECAGSCEGDGGAVHRAGDSRYAGAGSRVKGDG